MDTCKLREFFVFGMRFLVLLRFVCGAVGSQDLAALHGNRQIRLGLIDIHACCFCAVFIHTAIASLIFRVEDSTINWMD